MDKASLPMRHIVGILVFDSERFLLLHRVKNWKGWEYTKGEINHSEKHEDAIKRELFEETSIQKFELVGRVDSHEFFDKVRNKNSVITNYLVRVPSTVKVSFSHQPIGEDGKHIIEHDDYKWCFPEEALKLLTHKDTKESLSKAIQMLGLEVPLKK